MILKKIISFSVFLFVVQAVMAQDKASIKATVDKKKILIGEPMVLTVEASLPLTTKFITIDTIEHFEIGGKPQIDSSVSAGRTTIKATYRLTSFDSGHWVIPSFVLAKNVRTDSIPVDVVFSDFDPAQDYHDIKDILDVNPPKKKNDWWWYVGGGVLLLALIIYLILRKKPVVVAKPKVTTNPFEEAMLELEQLKRNKPATKEYYSRLTDIFRVYIFRKKQILSLQKTTDDLVLQLKGLNLEKDEFDKLAQSLRLGDFVKFAKFIPSPADDENASEDIKRSIITIEKKESAQTVPVKN